MKKQILLLSLLLSVTASAFADKEVNMLVNGGLEEWLWIAYPLDMPEGWFCHNNTNVKKENKIVCEGNYSAKMQSQET